MVIMRICRLFWVTYNKYGLWYSSIWFFIFGQRWQFTGTHFENISTNYDLLRSFDGIAFNKVAFGKNHTFFHKNVAPQKYKQKETLNQTRTRCEMSTRQHACAVDDGTTAWQILNLQELVLRCTQCFDRFCFYVLRRHTNNNCIKVATRWRRIENKMCFN